jgi:hypothetical protein
MCFKGGGLERFGQALKAGLFEGEGRRVAHEMGFRQKKNGSTGQPLDAVRGDRPFYLGVG